MAPEEERDPQVRVVDRRWWARGDTAADDAAAQSSSLKPTYVEDLERRIADLSGQLQAALASQRRSSDEFEQVRTRLRRDTAREVERGKRTVLVELLDVVDNLERAITAGSDTAGNAQLARGIELVRDQFLAKLSSFGVERVPTLGVPFDAMRHEAASTTPVDDPEQDGVVVAVIKEGYSIGDEVLRPAVVVVGKL
jgi:molecular chaperone GrpE